MSAEPEMIERVARAICGETPDRLGPITCDDGRRVPSGKPTWTAWEGDARAAIEAMRPANNSMLNAGEWANGACCIDEQGNIELNPDIIWEAMIDAALQQETIDA